jgi:hypothetical protein
MAEAAIFTCSICGDPSGEICVFCTKDTCINHHCDRCKRCSDCCECEIPLSAAAPEVVVVELPREPEVETPLESQVEAPRESQEPMAIEEPVTMEPPHPTAESEIENAPERSEDLLPPHPERPLF